MPYDKPAAEVPLDEGVVRQLLVEQCPQWSDLPITFLMAGWDNAMFRIGDEFLARVPRRELSVPLIEFEQRWLPELAPALPLPIPVPVHAGIPSDSYPWPWSVVPHAPGRSTLEIAVEENWSPGGVAGSVAVAEALGSFVAALATLPVPDDPPLNPFRGIPLRDRNDRFNECIDACRDVLDPPTIDRAQEAWERALSARIATSEGWLHGDLHPGNVIVDGDSVSVIDFGDMCTGDRAGDLFCGWQLFEPEARAVFRSAARVDDATWERGRGWALAFGLTVLANSADDPVFTTLGRRSIEAVIFDKDRGQSSPG